MTVKDHYGRDEETESKFDTHIPWRGGLLAGFVATVATTLVLLPTNASLFSETIAGMYGFEGVLAVGLLTHLIHGTLFGLVFAAVLSDPGLVYISNSIPKTVLAGLLFGFVLTVVGTGFLLPAWSQFAGLSSPPDMPWVTLPLFSWHALYGIVLGLLFPFLEEL